MLTLAARHALVLPLVVCGVSFSLLAVVGLMGWPGEIGSSGMNFCEASAPGIIQQPANSWSNLGFAFAGIAIGIHAWRSFEQRARSVARYENRMRSRLLYPVLYACVAAFVGPASMALHASTTVWGGVIDLMSMFFWAAFALAYGLTRVFELDDVRFVRSYFGLVAIISIVYLGNLVPVSGSAIFGIILGLYSLTEGWIMWQRPDLSAKRSWLWATLVIFLTAFGIWLPSRTGGPLCDPHSLVQGHAIWHLLNAMAMGTLYLFYLSERSRTARA